MNEDIDYYHLMGDLFFDKAIKRGMRMNLYKPLDVIPVIEKLKELDVPILGLDAFVVWGGVDDSLYIQPFMEHECDFTGLSKEEGWSEAIKKMKEYADSGFVFELVV